MNPCYEHGMLSAFVPFKDGFWHGKIAGWYRVWGQVS